MLCGEFKYIIHKHLQQQTQAANQTAISAEQTVYLFIKNTPPRTGALMSELYESSRDEDGFLYMQYSAENTLGQ